MEIILSAKDHASRVLESAGKNASGLGKHLGDVAKIAGGFVVGQGITQLGGFLMDAAKAAAEDAASVSRLQRAVENTGASFGDYKKQIDDVISRGQKLGFTDDQTRDSLSLLAAQTGDTEEAVKRYALAQDLARGANIDVVTASKLLGKVTDENVSALARYGVAAKEGMTQTELFAAVQTKFGGQAAAFGETTAGEMEQVKIRIGELKESLGAALLPVMANVMQFLVTTGVPALEATAKFLQENKTAAIAAAAVIGGVLVAGFVALGIAAASAAVGVIAATWPLLAIVVAIAAVSAAIYLLITNFDDVKKWLGQHWPEVATLISGPFAPLVILATDAFGIRSALEEAFKKVISFLLGLAGDFYDAGKALANSLVKGLKDFGGDVLETALNAGTFGLYGVGKSALGKRAAGGPVMAGHPYIVGERGPEIFVPGQSGGIVPNGAAAGITQVVNITGNTILARYEAETGRVGRDIGWSLMLRGVAG